MHELIHLWKCVYVASNLQRMSVVVLLTRFSCICYESFSILNQAFRLVLVLINVEILNNYTSLDDLYIHCRMMVILM